MAEIVPWLKPARREASAQERPRVSQAWVNQATNGVCDWDIGGYSLCRCLCPA
jgi:hypothetical protein